MGESAEEARIALKYGSMHSNEFVGSMESDSSRESFAFRFKRYFPFYVADPMAHGEDLFHAHDIAESVLGSIEQDDARNGTFDLAVLRAYLRFSCRTSDAAAFLGKHRNSVSYRLRYMQRTYDFDLSDPDDAAFLQALMILPR